jgi:hypothetical protein
MLHQNRALDRAKLSLEGLSLGDAFGELYMSVYPNFSNSIELPSGAWQWMKDTWMARVRWCLNH